MLKLKPNRPWSAEDHQKIIDMLTADACIEDVAKALHRSVSSIRVQATKLRVSASANLKQRAVRNEALRKGVTVISRR